MKKLLNIFFVILLLAGSSVGAEEKTENPSNKAQKASILEYDDLYQDLERFDFSCIGESCAAKVRNRTAVREYIDCVELEDSSRQGDFGNEIIESSLIDQKCKELILKKTYPTIYDKLNNDEKIKK